MTLNELISKLQKAAKKHGGDLTVKYADLDHQAMCSLEITEVEIVYPSMTWDEESDTSAIDIDFTLSDEASDKGEN